METKTYYAKELSEVLDQVKHELGDDAIIVRSRRTRQKGFLGLFQSSVYEVVVSYDPEEAKKHAEGKANSPKPDNPLSSFGRDADKRFAAAAAAATAKRNAAREKRVDETIQPMETATFAELVQMAGTLEKEDVPVDTVQPAWITPGAKVNAYLSLQQPPAAQAAPATPTRTIAYTPPKDMHVPQQSARAEIVADLPHISSYQPPPLPGGRSDVMPDVMPGVPAGVSPDVPEGEESAPANVHIPEKRRRGRPPKSVGAPKAPKSGGAPKPQRTTGAAKPLPAAPEPVAKREEKQGEAIITRLDVVEQMLRALMTDMRSGEGAGMPLTADGAGYPEWGADEAERLRDCLIRQDVSPDVADELLKMVDEIGEASGLTQEAALERVLRNVLGKPKYLRGSTKTARTVMLVGPTGVGKTTTLVKLAAGCIFERRARVAIINADIFRVGAQDQLKAYAKILDVPVKAIYSAKELKPAVEEYGSYDFIFIDTCGKASTDKEYQNEIRELLNTGKVQDTYLVVSSTTAGRVCRNIVENYAFIGQYKTILTKVDESGSVGGAVNLAFYSGQPLSYVTIGQNVPDDISKLDVDEVIKQLIKES